MALRGLLIRPGLDEDSLKLVDELLSTVTGPPIHCASESQQVQRTKDMPKI